LKKNNSIEEAIVAPKRGHVRENIEAILVAILIALFIRTFVVQALKYLQVP